MWKFTNKYVPNNTHVKISKFSRNTSQQTYVQYQESRQVNESLIS